MNKQPNDCVEKDREHEAAKPVIVPISALSIIHFRFLKRSLETGI
jgi:hypothetical protein